MANSSQFTRMMRLPDAPDYADYADCSAWRTGRRRALSDLSFLGKFPIVGGGPPGLPAARRNPRNQRNLRLAVAVSPFARARTALGREAARRGRAGDAVAGSGQSLFRSCRGGSLCRMPPPATSEPRVRRARTFEPRRFAVAGLFALIAACSDSSDVTSP